MFRPTKLFLILLTVVATAAALVGLQGHRPLSEQMQQRARNQLNAAYDLFIQSERVQAYERIGHVRLMASDPTVAGLIEDHRERSDIPDPGGEPGPRLAGEPSAELDEVAARTRRATGYRPHLVLVVDHAGHPVVWARPSGESDFTELGEDVQRQALEQGVAAERLEWGSEGAAYVTAVPVVDNHRAVVGAVVAFEAIDTARLTAWARRLGAELALFQDGRVLASSLEPGELRQAVDDHLIRVANEPEVFLGRDGRLGELAELEIEGGRALVLAGPLRSELNDNAASTLGVMVLVSGRSPPGQLAQLLWEEGYLDPGQRDVWLSLLCGFVLLMLGLVLIETDARRAFKRYATQFRDALDQERQRWTDEHAAALTDEVAPEPAAPHSALDEGRAERPVEALPAPGAPLSASARPPAAVAKSTGSRTVQMSVQGVFQEDGAVAPQPAPQATGSETTRLHVGSVFGEAEPAAADQVVNAAAPSGTVRLNIAGTFAPDSDEDGDDIPQDVTQPAHPTALAGAYGDYGLDVPPTARQIGDEIELVEASDLFPSSELEALDDSAVWHSEELEALGEQALGTPSVVKPLAPVEEWDDEEAPRRPAVREPARRRAPAKTLIGMVGPNTMSDEPPVPLALHAEAKEPEELLDLAVAGAETSAIELLDVPLAISDLDALVDDEVIVGEALQAAPALLAATATTVAEHDERPPARRRVPVLESEDVDYSDQWGIATVKTTSEATSSAAPEAPAATTRAPAEPIIEPAGHAVKGPSTRSSPESDAGRSSSAKTDSLRDALRKLKDLSARRTSEQAAVPDPSGDKSFKSRLPTMPKLPPLATSEYAVRPTRRDDEEAAEAPDNEASVGVSPPRALGSPSLGAPPPRKKAPVKASAVAETEPAVREADAAAEHEVPAEPTAPPAPPEPEASSESQAPAEPEAAPEQETSAAEAVEPEPQEAEPATPVEPELGTEPTDYEALFEQFLQARRECGEPTEGINFERFASKIRANERSVRARFGCEQVQLEVYVKNGKAAVKAMPISK